MGTYTGQDKRLKYLFENGGGGGGASALSQLTDVELTNLADGQIIKYDISLQKWVNAEESGGSGGGGSVIDWSNEIFSDAYTVTTNPYVYSYTATQNCFVVFDVINNLNTVSDVTIETEIVSQTYSNALIQDRKILFLAKGETVEVKSTYINAQLGFKAFGIRTVGVQYVDIADIYSTDEKVVGVWIDGKPIYQKTYEFSTPIQVVANQYTTLVGSSGLNIDTLIYGESAPSKDATFTPISVNNNSDNIQCYYSTAWSIKFLTIRYTKTTDTAGSGIYVPSGSYATHYTTDEQIIGTWIDGSTLYRKTFVNTGTTVTCNSNTWTSITFASVPNLSRIIDASVYDENGTKFAGCYANINDVFAFYNVRTVGVNLNNGSQVTLEYTKTI